MLYIVINYVKHFVMYKMSVLPPESRPVRHEKKRRKGGPGVPPGLVQGKVEGVPIPSFRGRCAPAEMP